MNHTLSIPTPFENNVFLFLHWMTLHSFFNRKKTMSDDGCAICTDPLTKTRSAVGCPRCPHVACSRCVKMFLLKNTIEPRCMSCQAPWDMDFLRQNLSKSFLDTGYRKHQISTLMSRAEACLGGLQHLVPVKTRMLTLQQEIRALDTNASKHHRRALQQEKKALEREWESTAAKEPVATTTFFMACPRKDCRGRVSSDFQCGLCEHWICPACHGDKGFERDGVHECLKEDKETVDMLKTNTKHCPECHEGIFKDYGCDQMWCTRCHTCFSWETGRKMIGTIHNPHYYEHRFQNTERGGCRLGFPLYDRLVEKWSQRFSWGAQHELDKMHRLVHHLRFVDLHHLRETLAHHEILEHRKWGVEYLRQKISREAWGQKLYLAYRKTQRLQEIHDILQTLVVATCDVYQRWFHDEMEGSELLVSVRALVAECNRNMAAHNKRFGTKTPLVDPNREIRDHILDVY